MAEQKDNTSNSVDDSYYDIQRQRAEAAKNNPNGPMGDIFDGDPDGDNQQQDNSGSSDYDSDYDSDYGSDGASAEEQEEAEAENDKLDEENDSNDDSDYGDYDDGLDDGGEDYSPDRDEETRAREDERENIRGDEAEDEPQSATVEEQEEAEAENAKRGGRSSDKKGKSDGGEDSAETAGKNAAATELTDEAAEATGEALEGGAVDAVAEGVADVLGPEAAIPVAAAEVVSRKVFHMSLGKLVMMLLISIPLAAIGLFMAAGLGLTSFTATADPLDPGTGTVGASIVSAAKTQIKKPYVWAGICTNPGPPDGCANYDCSGLTYWAVYWGTDKKVKLPHSSQQQCGNGGTTPANGTKVNKDELKPGDLVCFGSPIHHVGIFVGEGEFIHAPTAHGAEPWVRINNLADRDDFVTGIRIDATK